MFGRFQWPRTGLINARDRCFTIVYDYFKTTEGLLKNNLNIEGQMKLNQTRHLLHQKALGLILVKSSHEIDKAAF